MFFAQKIRGSPKSRYLRALDVDLDQAGKNSVSRDVGIQGIEGTTNDRPEV